MFGGLIATPGVVFFNSSTPVVVLSGLDVSSPSITFAEPSRGLAITGQAIPLRFLATDKSTTLPTLECRAPFVRSDSWGPTDSASSIRI